MRPLALHLGGILPSLFTVFALLTDISLRMKSSSYVCTWSYLWHFSGDGKIWSGDWFFCSLINLWHPAVALYIVYVMRRCNEPNTCSCGSWLKLQEVKMRTTAQYRHHWNCIQSINKPYSLVANHHITHQHHGSHHSAAATTTTANTNKSIGSPITANIRVPSIDRAVHTSWLLLGCYQFHYGRILKVPGIPCDATR